MNLILCMNDRSKVWDRWLSRQGDVHKSSIHAYDFDTVSINRVWEIYIYWIPIVSLLVENGKKKKF